MTTTLYPGAPGRSGAPDLREAHFSPDAQPEEAVARSHPSRWLLVAGAAILAAGVLLRFWTRSNLWLDEAQTLNIARLPLAKIPAALRQDGAPPLYYLLLHFWSRLFGTSNLAVRSLPATLGTIALPLSWWAGRALGGRRVAGAAVLLTASSPFAIWYSTDNRMYTLVTVEVLAGGLLLASALDRPRWWNLAGTGAAAASLLYTHYWALFFLPAVIAGLLIGAWRGRRSQQSLLACLAIGVGCLAWLPWLPSFLFQLSHTGTPWTTPAGLSMLPDTVLQFAGGSSNEGIALEAVLYLLAFVGVAGVAGGAWRVELDLRGRLRSRWLAGLVLGTLMLAVIGGQIAGTGFQDRYAAVVFPPFVLLCAYGVLALSPAALRRGLIGVAAALGLLSASHNVTADRTQATQVAAVIGAHARSGDVVGYCPDQLAPDTARLLPGRLHLTQITFPRGTGPGRVDWVNYLATIRTASPAEFAGSLLAAAGPTHTVWYVWQTGYRGFGNDCRTIADLLNAARPDGVRRVNPQWPTYLEPSRLTIFRPLGGPPAR